MAAHSADTSSTVSEHTGGGGADAIQVERRLIPGLLRIQLPVHSDERGTFVKTYHEAWFKELGLPIAWPESFHSSSKRGVIRGLHLQRPPADHDKLVYCLRGAALDVVVDLRVGSPTFGEYEAMTLDEESRSLLFVPSGLAHGFAALSDDTFMGYATSTMHDAAYDEGICWNSLPIDWPFPSPILSERDAALPRFEDYESPFVYSDNTSTVAT